MDESRNKRHRQALVIIGAAVALLPAATRAAGARPQVAPAVAAFVATHTAPARAGEGVAAIRWLSARRVVAGGPTVVVSAAYASDPGIAGRWSHFFTSLVHGPELELLTAYIAPLNEIAELCGDHALGCYTGQRLFTVGTNVGSVSAEAVAAHEYGHHVSYNRVNAPWIAASWGTKRWATRMNVCARVASGTAFPGDEGTSYVLNPGEAFAETYRVLNGYDVEDWSIVDASFRPDDAALAAVRADVVEPWAPTPARAVSGRFRRGQQTWTQKLATPLDGLLRLKLRVVPNGAAEVALVDADGRMLEAGAWSGVGTKSLEYRVCGTRFVTVRVTRAGRVGRFTLSYTTP